MKKSRFLALSAATLLLHAVGCAQVQSPGGAPESRAEKAGRRSDALCLQDCLGTQADREFCEDRCSF